MYASKRRYFAALVCGVVTALAIPSWATATPPDDTPDRPHSQNMHLLGSSLRAGAVTGPPPVGPGDVPWDTRNTDLAFWGDTVIQGRYDGFRVINARAPGNPVERAFFTCVSPQGDVGVYGNLVFRSVDSPQRTNQCSDVAQSGNPPDVDCAPVSAPCTGFEGIQIFDISDLSNIELVASVPLDCGSHTHTVVPDPEGDRVLIYNSVSGAGLQANPGKYGNRCPGLPFNREDIVEVPLSDPGSASVIGSFSLGQMPDGRVITTCHDLGVILGSVNRAACAGNPGVPVFDISDLENPVFLYATSAPTVTGFHSAAWSWDGSILVTGWEPGGGTLPRCQATGTPISPPTAGSSVQTDEMKTIFFHDGATGEIIGRHVLPRPQSQYENCTMHNYNVVAHPTRNLLVHGSYQSGTALVDFTDPANAYEVAWMDPDPLDPPSDTSPGGRINFRGGDWSSYWYNGRIYESDTRRGLYIWDVSAPEVRGPVVKLDHLNPQTNHVSIP
ncbi:hypothetical protein [Kribbella catacumbae]|uniref:hypothetical protein n=1 Tax=Kribbella catacumbae TaxID=460086 RepID=UPI00039F0821|nr:hypothetical protein [Kribbella catacumbae]